MLAEVAPFTAQTSATGVGAPCATLSGVAWNTKMFGGSSLQKIVVVGAGSQVMRH